MTPRPTQCLLLSLTVLALAVCCLAVSVDATPESDATLLESQGAFVELHTKANLYGMLDRRGRGRAAAAAAGRGSNRGKSSSRGGRSSRGRGRNSGRRGAGKQRKSKKRASKKSKRRTNRKSRSSSSSFRRVSADALALRGKHSRREIRLSKSQQKRVNAAIHWQDKQARKPSAKLIRDINNIKKAVKRQRK